MIDYMVNYIYNKFDDITLDGEMVITLEEVIEDDELLLEDILLENLKEQVSDEVRYVEIIDFQEIVKRDNLYRFEYKDVYFE